MTTLDDISLTVDSQRDPPSRVFLWAQPRSRSTIFELSMASVASFKVFHEPYFVPDIYDEDRKETSQSSGQSYTEVTQRLEADYPGKTAIFAKDFAWGLHNIKNHLPSGYIHTFLIRDPKQSVISDLKMTMEIFRGMCPEALIELLRSRDMKPTLELYKYVTEELKQKPIIIDSDDLAEHPREVIQKYCTETNLPFHESMLTWEPGNTSHWPSELRAPPFVNYHKTAISSSCYLPPSKTDGDREGEIPDKVLELIKSNQPIYDEMKKNKLQI